MVEPWQVTEGRAGWGPAERAALDRCFAVPAGSGVPGVRRGRLARTIETEIIPRLMLAHRGEEGGSAARRPNYSADVAELASFAIGPDPRAAMDLVADLLRRGEGFEHVLLDVLAPAARLLGDLWREDVCTFTDVTIGLSRLQQILRSFGTGFEAEAGENAGRILLATVPGEQHSLGISILEEFFRREGWQVDGGCDLSLRELSSMVKRGWYDAVGLSLSCDILFEQARRTIEAIRKASRNPSVVLMVGGRFFMDNPGRVVEIGADTTAFDAPAARRSHG